MTKELYRQRKAEGLCTKCGEKATHKSLCLACREKETVRACAYYKRHRQQILKWTGEYNQLHKEQIAARNRKRYQNFLEKLARVKCAPCTDCGIQYNPWVMEFDHLDASTKVADISHMRDWNKIQEEIKKCELVCANCHRERTHSRSRMVTNG